MIKLEIPHWSSHHNMIIYSLLYYSYENQEHLTVLFNKALRANGAVLYKENKTIFFDFSDDIILIDNPNNYDYYFKRSYLSSTYIFKNVYPLNFQVNYSYKSLNLLKKFSLKELIDKNNRIEILRALDFFNLFTNLSHNAMDVRLFPKKIKDNNGKIIFQTRLWNPDNHPDWEEKKRRELQNEFRIEACRIIKKNFKNTEVGLFPDKLAVRIASDVLLNEKKMSKMHYFKELKRSDIAIADDGLKDTPGWKIGEYLLFGKAVITTPITVKIEDFREGINYEKLSTRNSYSQLPEKIEYLLSENRYMEMGNHNLIWSENYLHPKNYIKRILSVIEK